MVDRRPLHAEGNIHIESWLYRSDMIGVRDHEKDLSIGPRRTSIRAKGYSQVARRMYPSRDRGHPSGLMVTGKQAEGSIPRPGGLLRCSLMDAGKQAQGSTLSRAADTHGPSWSQGNDEKDASLGRKACAHRVTSTPATEGKAHRFADRARPCALIEVRIRRRAPGMHREGRGPGSLRYRHRPGEPYSIAPMRGSLRALGVGVRREGASFVRGRGGASGQGRMHVRHDRRRRGL